MTEDRNKDTLIEQYKRCCEDWRHFDKLLWQIPFSTVVATSSLLTLAYVWIKEIFVRQLLIISLIIFVFVMAVLAIKIRFFQDARTEFAKEVEEKLKVNNMPIETSESLEYLAKRGKSKGCLSSSFLKIFRAFYVQLFMYVGLVVILIILLIWPCM